MQRQQQPKRKPLGHTINWSDQDLQQMATITPADIKNAVAMWHNDAPERLAGLLDASDHGQSVIAATINRF
jgi:hypothetical protein